VSCKFFFATGLPGDPPRVNVDLRAANAARPGGNPNANPLEDTMVKFIRDEQGATAIEYGLIASLIAVAIIGALTALGGGLNGIFGQVTAQL
jgi:pilus assembly protein Flp/PilA